MLCFSGFELYSRWVPLSEAIVPTFVAISVSGTMLSESLFVCQLHKNRGRT